MGNIHASSPGFPSPLPTSPIPPSPTIPGQGDKEGSQTPLEPQGSDMLSGSGDDAFPNNPGTMEDLHKKCKDVFPVVFEGGKFMLNKPISNHFQVAHTLNFSSIQPSGYKFSATYVGMKQTGPAEAYPVLLGEIDPSGNLNANMIHQFTPNLKGKLVTQIQQSKCQATQMSADWRGSDYTASLTLGNVDVVNDAGVFVGHYLQKITPQLDLGAEIAYQRGAQVPGGHIAVHSMAGRYTGDKYVASGTIGGAGLHLCYYRKASETLQFGVELESSAKMQESTASFAYQVDIPKANFTFRGTVDSNWTVGAVIEKKLMPLPFTFALSAVHNYPKNQFKLGCGFIVG